MAQAVEKEGKHDERTRLIKSIHARARDAGLDGEGRRALQVKHTGKRSLTDMKPWELRVVRQALRDKARDNKRGLNASPHRRLLRALWVSGYHLGVMQSASDRALEAWIVRQAGVDAARFAWTDTGPAVEALKAWLARPVNQGGGGVDWSPYPDGNRNQRARVIEAQYRIILQKGTASPRSAESGNLAACLRRRHGLIVKDCLALPPDRMNAVIRVLGREIRGGRS